MNKIFIPAILSAIILLSGLFALVHIEQASTLHTTIIGDLEKLTVETITNFEQTGDAGGTVTITVLVLNADGTPLTTLDLADFTVDGVSVTEALDETVAAGNSAFAEIGSGVYELIVDCNDGVCDTAGDNTVRITVDPDTESTEARTVVINYEDDSGGE